MNADATNFYDALSTTSFTLLGLWFAFLQFAPQQWRTDPRRRRMVQHAALHFFLPGTAGLASLLFGAQPPGYGWRGTLIVVGLIGLVESIVHLREPHPAGRRAVVALRWLDPILYALFVVLAPWAPLQSAGIPVGLVFIAGMIYLWFAFVERIDADGQAPSGRFPAQYPAAQPAIQYPAAPYPAAQYPAGSFPPPHPAAPSGAPEARPAPPEDPPAAPPAPPGPARAESG